MSVSVTPGLYISHLYHLTLFCKYMYIINRFVHNNVRLILTTSNPTIFNRKSSDTVLVFFVNKTLWPSYHYLLPWDYKSGEYGTYGSGLSTAILRICAVLGLAYDLTTCTAEGIKSALKTASNTKRPLTDCLLESKVNSSMPELLDIRQHSK